MPILNGKKVTPFPGIKMKSTDALRDAVIQFDNVNTAPTTSSGYYYLYVTGGVLKFDNGSTTYNLLTGAGGGISSWDGLYDSDTTLTVDGASLTFSGTHATNDVITILNATGSGDCLQFTNTGTGSDVKGTSDTWSVSKAGVAVFTAITGCDSLTAAANLALDATGTGTITLAGTSTGAITLTTAVTATASITITGSADTTVFAITDGDATMSNGLLSITSDDTTSGSIAVTASATSGKPISVTANALTSGAALYVSSTNEASFSGDGGYLNLTNNGTSVFKVQRYGATTIAGTATATASLTLTKGDLVLSGGAMQITDTSSAVGTFLVHNDTVQTLGAAADAGVVDFDSETLSTGVLLNLSLDETTLNGGYYFRCYGQDAGAAVYTIGEYGATVITTATSASSLIINSATATSDAMQINVTALTTGDALQISNTAETIAAGELVKVVNTENGDMSATPKTGNMNSFTSSCTMTTESVTLDYDNMLISRSDIANQGTKTLTAQGSALKILYTATDTAGTCTSTVVGLEVQMADGGTAAPTGDAVKVTSVGVGAKAINVVSASTTVDDVLITGSGVKADNKASLQITNSGATAAGGSVLRVAKTGTPAAATSYLVDFDHSGATMTNNPITFYLNSGSSTGSAVYTTGSGAGNSLATYNTNTGATGVQWFTEHTSTGSAADNDVVFRMTMAGLDDADATNNYARIDVTAIDVSAGTEDGKLDLQVSVGGTLTSMLYVQSSTAGATSCVVGAASMTIAGSAAGTAALTVTNGDISLSAGKFIATTTADIYGLDITVNKAAATQGVAVLTNASTTSAKSVLELEQADLDKPYIKFSGATAITSATAGANGDVPAQVVGYLNVDVDGTERRIPYYAA